VVSAGLDVGGAANRRRSEGPGRQAGRLAGGTDLAGEALTKGDHDLLRSVRRAYHAMNHSLRASAKRAVKH
jgi:hypothetical protein